MPNDNKTRILSYTTDSSCLRDIKTGSETAWREFYLKYYGMIRFIGKKRNLTPEDCAILNAEHKAVRLFDIDCPIS